MTRQQAVREAFRAGFNAVVKRARMEEQILRDAPYEWEFPERGTSAADLEPQAWAAYARTKDGK